MTAYTPLTQKQVNQLEQILTNSTTSFGEEYRTLLTPLRLLLDGAITLPSKKYTNEDILLFYSSITTTIHAFRRIFTQHYHAGHMNINNNNGTTNDATETSSSSATASTKRSRTTTDGTTNTTSLSSSSSASSDTSISFRTGFLFFVNSLIQLLNYKLDKKHKQYTEEFDEKIVDLQVLGLSTLVHFSCHSISLLQQIQQGALTLNNDYMVYLYRHFLTAGGVYAQQYNNDNDDENTLKINPSSSSSSIPSPFVFSCYHHHYSRQVPTMDLSLTLQTLRQEFMDDYDDIRYTSLRVIRDICQSKLLYEESKGTKKNSNPSSTTKKHDRDTTNSSFSPENTSTLLTDSFIGASEILIEQCHPHILTRNVAEVLLNISLPLVEEEWLNSEHESYGYSQLSSLITSYAQDHSMPLSASLTQDPASSFTVSTTNDNTNHRTSNAKFLKADSDDDDDTTYDHGNSSTSGLPVGLSKKSSKKSSQKFMDYYEVRKLYGEAWLMLLRLPLPNDVLRRILLALPTRILPLFIHNQPLLLSDFLTDACNEGNANTLLALQSLFILMQQHGLEYPRFYPRLYTLLNTVTASAKYRDRFFTLLDLFLSSPALPVYLVASFMKRLCRVALTAPLGFAFFAIPAVYNLCKRHPSVMMLLHRAVENGKNVDDKPKLATTKNTNALLWPRSADPFNDQTNELASTNAMASSLWELVALQHHYHGPIATLARNFIAEMTKSEYDIAQYTGITTTYSHIITNECERTVRTQGGNRTDIQIPLEFIQPQSFYTSIPSLTTILSSSTATKKETIPYVTNDGILRL